MAPLAFLAALLLVAVALWLLLTSRRQRSAAGLPPGRIVYADTGAWEGCERPLYSPRFGLSGKPDYLVRERGTVVPIEVKPKREAGQPYLGDVLQLAAYCLLAEEEYGKRPAYGYLKYRQALWRIDNTPALRQQLLAELEAVRRHSASDDVAPSHSEPQRCLACGHRAHCGRPLA